MTHTNRRRGAAARVLTTSALFAAATYACSSSDPSDPVVSSRSYRGHESDLDVTNFVNVYPDAVGTRLDDCQTCHTGGTFTNVDRDRQETRNPCDFCHLVIHPVEGYAEPPLPTTYRETLNPFGVAYMDAGRTEGALRDIAGEDSDEDGADNEAEIDALRYPGDPASHPDQEAAPMVIFGMEDLLAMPEHSQFLLANTTRQQFDDYSTYRGVTVADLLEAAGVDPTDPEITGITVIAPDGYLADFSIEDVNRSFPAADFFAGLDADALGADCGFVQYAEEIPDGVQAGEPIPGDLRLLFAYERDGLPMESASLDVTVGKLSGEGPYRLVLPQAEAGQPDRGVSYSPSECGDDFDFDDTLDHNAGAMVRGAVAIRVNPLPEGFEDFDYRNGGWAFVDGSTVGVYGHGVTAP